jgi:hypothetical protein
MQRSLEDCYLLISSAALVTRGWLAPESGKSQVESKDRCYTSVKFGKCIDRQLEWSIFGAQSLTELLLDY